MYAFALALLLMTACASSGEPPPRVPAQQSESPAAAPAGQDSLIQARVGEEFVITLASNPSTGHQWRLADSLDARLLRLAGRTYVPAQPVKVGSGGHERFTFVALAPGETTIRMRYERGVQRSAPGRAEFRVRIHPAAP
jgi:inhibitor of cysteine peptidase